MMDSKMAQTMVGQISRETNLVETRVQMRAHYSAQNSAQKMDRTKVEKRVHCSAQNSAQTMARTTVEMMALMKVLMLDW